MSDKVLLPPQIIPWRARTLSNHSIDTNTLIEIRSDRNNVDIYYTLDGAKPSILVTLATRKSTIVYRKPFYIPIQRAAAGQVTVKAVVVSR
jgi:hypothetical protein